MSHMARMPDACAPAGTYFAPLSALEASRLPADVVALCAAFARRLDAQHCQTRRGAFDQCGYLSTRFADVARAAGLRTTVLRLTGAPFDDHRRLMFTVATPYRVQHPSAWRHHVACVGGRWVVDWTARQYDPACPFPVIRSLSTVRHSGRGWTHVSTVLGARGALALTRHGVAHRGLPSLDRVQRVAEASHAA
jgi:hypothetical protein